MDTFAPLPACSHIPGVTLLLIMEIELHPTVSLTEETFNVLIAPVEMLVDALNSNLNLQRFKILFISGNYSRILTRLDRRFTSLEVRRAFTSFQLMTILEENHHSFLIVEHDPMLYEDAKHMGGHHPALLTFAGSPPAEDDRAGRPGVLHLRRGESTGERAGKDARRPGHFGGVLMRWPWIREARLIEPRPAINPKVLELQTAKEILGEVFHAPSRRGGGDDTDEASPLRRGQN
jgi:hypothetical protein